MNIKRISYGLIGTFLTAGALTACTDSKYEDNAKAEAIKYLDGDQLLKAERFASMQPNYDRYSGSDMAYWDSLLIEAKSKEAYLKGQQRIRDSINKVYYRPEKFKAQLDTLLPDNIIDNAIEEYAKYTNAEEFIKARNNAPKDMHILNENVASTHFWNLITMAYKQNKAYQKGMSDARKELISK